MTTLTLILRIVFLVSASMALLSAARQDYHCGLVRRRTFLRAAACQFAASVAVVAGAWFVGRRSFDWLEAHWPVLNWPALRWLDLNSSSLTSSTPSPLQVSTQISTQIFTALSVGVGICTLGYLCHRLTRIAGKRPASAAVHGLHTRVSSKFSPQLPPQSGFGLADVWAAGLSAQTLVLLWPVTDALLLWCVLWSATAVHALISHRREERKAQRKEGGARQLRLLPHLLWTWSVMIPTLLLIHPP